MFCGLELPDDCKGGKLYCPFCQETTWHTWTVRDPRYRTCTICADEQAKEDERRGIRPL